MDPKTPSFRAMVTMVVDGRSAPRECEWSSRGMDSGCPPVPVAAGDTLKDWRADTVHASMSIVPEAEGACCGCEGALSGAAAVEVIVGGACAISGGGGTALYLPIAMS